MTPSRISSAERRANNDVCNQCYVEPKRSKRVNPAVLLTRHQKGDWGVLPDEDWRENEVSLRRGFRLLSSYPIGDDDEKVWIITEADRSVTTILRPQDY